MIDKLLPCPFCGCTAGKYNLYHLIETPTQAATYRGGVRCAGCGCETRATTPPDESIAAWNRRAPTALSGWISVDERKPCALEDVLLITVNFQCEIGYFTEDEGFRLNNDYVAEVTHWMPLPQLPEVQS